MAKSQQTIELLEIKIFSIYKSKESIMNLLEKMIWFSSTFCAFSECVQKICLERLKVLNLPPSLASVFLFATHKVTTFFFLHNKMSALSSFTTFSGLLVDSSWRALLTFFSIMSCIIFFSFHIYLELTTYPIKAIIHRMSCSTMMFIKTF